MNAGPDVERLISGWLHEEAPGRAPDRILEAAGRTIDRTRQRRFGAVWRESMSGLRGLAAAAVLGALVVAGAFYVLRPALGPGNQPSPSITASPSASAGAPPSAAPSAAPTRLTAGPLEIGFYDGPILRVADIVADLNADTTLTPADRTSILDVVMAIRDKSTYQISLEFRGGSLTQRETVDGNTIIGSFGRYSFPDDQTLVYTETIAGNPVVTAFELTIDGDSFTLRRTTPDHSAADAFVVDHIFEAGPFTLR